MSTSRGPYSQRALEESEDLLAEIGPERAVAAIKSSIRNNYQGIFEPRAGPRTAAAGPGQVHPKDKSYVPGTM